MNYSCDHFFLSVQVKVTYLNCPVSNCGLNVERLLVVMRSGEDGYRWLAWTRYWTVRGEGLIWGHSSS